MLTLLLNWIYMGMVIFITGYAGLKLICRMFGAARQYSFFHVMFIGIMLTTCYAQVFSLFTGVGAAANMVLILFCLGFAVVCRKDIRQMLSDWKTDMIAHDAIRGKKAGLFAAALIMVAAVFALAAAGPAKLIDTDWYHAQTIRWIEEYGSVKGIANLFPSLGFNSSQHYFDALFSMQFIFGQSLKGSGGFFALLLFLHGFFRLLKYKRPGSHIADAMAVAEIVYVIIITSFFTDPYTDTLPNCLTFFIFTEWIAMLEKEEKAVFPYALLCILAVFAAVVKTSAVLVALLVVYPAGRLIQKRAWKPIIGYLLTGIAVAVPFFLTNIRTSGYLVYLASAIDWFDVWWKSDIEIMKAAAGSMIHGVRGVWKPAEEVMNVGLRWVPDWFAGESASHKILYVAVGGILIYDVFMVIKDILTRRKLDWPMMLVRVVIFANLVYWLLTIPQVKYGWACLLAPLVIVPVFYLQREKGFWLKLTKISAVMAATVLLMYAAFYSYRTLGYVKTAIPSYLFIQADYERYEMPAVEKNGLTFYIRAEDGDQLCGYYVFPYIHDADILEYLVTGTRLRDGFGIR